MNNVDNLVHILRSLGGKATVDQIVDRYCETRPMAKLSIFSSFVKNTLDASPFFVVSDSGIYSLRDGEDSSPLPGPPPGPEGVSLLRRAAYEWDLNARDNGRISEVIGNVGERYFFITPALAKAVPRIDGIRAVRGSGYYCVYEVEIRPKRAVVRLMASVNKETPSHIIEIYKNRILPLIGKKFRPDGQYYNKMFHSMKTTSGTTKSDIIAFMEQALREIEKFELDL